MKTEAHQLEIDYLVRGKGTKRSGERTIECHEDLDVFKVHYIHIQNAVLYLIIFADQYSQIKTNKNYCKHKQGTRV